METTATTAATAPAAPTVLREEEESAARQLTADFETFLRLLTTQLQNQDPLQPMESTEFVAQLAQFSAVEQQIATNTALSRILEAINGAGAGSLGDWLGREVRAAAPLKHAGGPVEVFAPPAPEEALSAALVVRGAGGKEVARVPAEVGVEALVWDGKLANGDPAPAGTYEFEIDWALPDKATEQADAEVYVEVLEARRTDDGILLALDGGGSVRAADVSSLRAPREAAGG